MEIKGARLIPLVKRRNQVTVSSSCFNVKRLYPLVAHETARIHKAGLNVVGLDPGITLQNEFGAVARCEHPQDMFDRLSASTDNRFAAKYLGIYSDAL